MVFYDYKKHKGTKLHESLFWEYDMDRIDFQKMRVVVVQRVLERGDMDDFYAILNMYGMKGVREAFCDVPYMNARDMNFVCFYFKLKKEDLKCFKRQQWRQALWNC